MRNVSDALKRTLSGLVSAHEQHRGKPVYRLAWTPKRVRTVKGHWSVKMTFERYGHLFDDREADAGAIKRLEAAIVEA